MRWTNLAEIQANFDPHYRMSKEKMAMQHYVAQAHIEQQERHHRERLSIEREKISARERMEEEQGRAMVEREIIAGKNAIALANHNHILGQFAQGSALIDDMVRAQLEQENNWANVMANTMSQLLLNEADTIKQEKLEKLKHRQEIEQKVLSFNCLMIEKFVDSDLKTKNLAEEKYVTIIFRLVERALGLGETMMTEQDMNALVRGWMQQDGYAGWGVPLP